MGTTVSLNGSFVQRDNGISDVIKPYFRHINAKPKGTDTPQTTRRTAIFWPKRSPLTHHSPPSMPPGTGAYDMIKTINVHIFMYI